MSGREPRVSRPPVLPTRILEAALPADVRGRSILGDLLEEWHHRPRGLRRVAWYWAVSLRVSTRYALVSRRLPGAPLGSEGSIRSRLGEFIPWQDLRQALRRAGHAPWLTAVTVLALGVGVAAPTAMYALLVGVTRDLPVPEPEALSHVGRRYSPAIVRGAEMVWLRPFLDRVGAGDGILDAVGAFRTGEGDLSGEATFAERRSLAAVTPGVLEAAAVPPAMGRGILVSDGPASSGAPVVVLSHDLWRERFAEDPDVLGDPIRINGTSHTVVGVMPSGFRFPDDTDLWVPLDPLADGPAELVVRLAPHASTELLAEYVGAVAARLRAEGVVPADDPTALGVEPWAHRDLDANGRRLLTLMVALVSLVLVVACANVGHLFLTRALSRRSSVAVRLALGAGRWRVIRSQLVEAGFFAALGGIAGLGLAWIGVRLLANGMAARLAWWMDVRLDPAVAAFAMGCVVLAAVLTALVPAAQAARMTGHGALHGIGDPRVTWGRGLRRLTGGLMMGEVALAGVILVVAGLLTRGALANLELEEGFEIEAVLAGDFALRPDGFAGPDLVRVFHRELVSEASAEPGVRAAATMSHLPVVFSPTRRIEIEGRSYDRADDRIRTHVVHVSPGFLDVLGSAPTRGRALTWADAEDGGVALLVNEPFVRRHLEGEDPIGTRIRLAGSGTDGEPGPWASVVGVVPSLGMDNGRDFDESGIYLPMVAGAPLSAHLLVRAAPGTGVASLAPAARAALAELNPDVALTDAAPLGRRIAATRDMESLFAGLFTIFGVCGLVLAGVGLYALMAFSVGRRLPELGIRAALGASPGKLVRTTVAVGAGQVAAGVVVGMGLGALVAPAFGNVFMGYDPRDPVAFITVALTLLATGVAATVGPARRAASLEVAEVLRAD